MNRQYATIPYNDPQPYRTPQKNSVKFNNDYNILDDFEALDYKYSRSSKPNVRVEGYFGAANKGTNLGDQLGEMMIKSDSNLDVRHTNSNMIYNSAAPRSGYQNSEQPYVSDLFGSTQSLNKNNQLEK